MAWPALANCLPCAVRLTTPPLPRVTALSDSSWASAASTNSESRPNRVATCAAFGAGLSWAAARSTNSSRMLKRRGFCSATRARMRAYGSRNTRPATTRSVGSAVSTASAAPLSCSSTLEVVGNIGRPSQPAGLGHHLGHAAVHGPHLSLARPHIAGALGKQLARPHDHQQLLRAREGYVHPLGFARKPYAAQVVIAHQADD